ncbi:MAG: autotransporter domain-containing protein [Deltaproteobacteria bacterium]|jgi:outer membrane autotransporter protein|nr:autotransporter domain-containing protein [Deltaproteobacteria bacterium]
MSNSRKSLFSNINGLKPGLALGFLLVLALATCGTARAQTGVIQVTDVPTGNVIKFSSLPADPSLGADLNKYGDPARLYDGLAFGGPKDPLGGTAKGFVIRQSSPGKIYDQPNGTYILGTLTDFSVIGGVRFNPGLPGSTLQGTGMGNVVVIGEGAKVGAAGSGTFTGSVYGGLALNSDSDSPSNNRIYVFGEVGRNVFGGASHLGGRDVKDNIIQIGDRAKVGFGSMSTAGAYAGKAVGGTICANLTPGAPCDPASGKISGNQVVVQGGTARTVIGGIHENGASEAGAIVASNHAKVSGGHVTENVIGGQSSIYGTLDKNMATIEGSAKIGGNVYGAKTSGALPATTASFTGTLKNSVVTVTGGELSYGSGTTDIFGASAEEAVGAANIDNNTVSISGGTGIRDVVGGYTNSNGAVTKNGIDLSGNVVINSAVAGKQTGSSGSKNVTENAITFKGATVNGDVTAGWGTGDNVKNNNVSFQSGTNLVKGNLYGGRDTAAVSNNSLSFSGGTNTVEGQVSVGGSLAISGGRNVFKQTVGTNSSIGENISVTGGYSVFNGNMTAGSGNISISGGTAKLDSLGTTVAANAFSLGSGGVLDIGATPVTLGATNIKFENGSTLMIGSNGTDNGKIAISGTPAVTFDRGASFKLATVDGAPNYWDGKTLTTAGSNVYSGVDGIFAGSLYQVFQSNGDKDIVAKRRSFESALGGLGASVSGATPNLPTISHLIDEIESNGNNPRLITSLMNQIQSIDDISDVRTRRLALSQLTGEYVANVAPAVAGTVIKAQNAVYGRLDRIREVDMDFLTPPAAGSGAELNRVWVGGLGFWSDEKDSGGLSGYEYSGGGIAAGYDRKIDAVPGLLLGVSAAVSTGDLDDNNGLTSVDVDTAGVGVYGSYTLPNGVFFDANAGYAWAKNDVATNLILGGQATGSFDVNSWQFGLRGGAILRYDNFQFIPSVGVRYLTLEQEAWSESVTGNSGNFAPHRFNKISDHQVDIPVQLKVNTSIQSGAATITPELRLGWTYAAKKPDHFAEASFAGVANSRRIGGIEARSHTFQAGTGVKVNTGGLLDVFVNYDLDAGSGYKNHNISAGLGFVF